MHDDKKVINAFNKMNRIFSFCILFACSAKGQYFPYDPSNPHPEVSQPCLEQITYYQDYLASDTPWTDRPEWVFKSKCASFRAVFALKKPVAGTKSNFTNEYAMKGH